MTESRVDLYIYDLSKGLAKNMSQMLLGKQVNGVWHTSIVAYDSEFYFGGMGIESCPPRCTILGPPDRIENMGLTQVPFDMFMEYVAELATTTFKPEAYHLLDHNCNTFSAEISQFLTGQSIPDEITSLPSDILSTPFGQMLRPMLEQMSVQPSGGQSVFTGTQASAATGTSQQTPDKKKETTSSNDHIDDKNNSNVASHENKNIPSQHSVDSPANRLKQWIQHEDPKSPVSCTLTLDELISDAGIKENELKDLCDSMDTEFLCDNIVIDILHIITAFRSNTLYKIVPNHLENLGRAIQDNLTPVERRHLSINLLSLCLLQPTIPKMTSPTAPICCAVRAYSNIPPQCKLALLRLLVNGLSTSEGYISLRTSDPNLVAGIVVDALCSEDGQSDNLDVVASVIHNWSLYCKDEEEFIGPVSAMLQLLQIASNPTAVEKLIISLIRFMDLSDTVMSLVMTMDLDWDRLSTLSPEISRLTSIIRSVIL